MLIKTIIILLISIVFPLLIMAEIIETQKTTISNNFTVTGTSTFNVVTLGGQNSPVFYFTNDCRIAMYGTNLVVQYYVGGAWTNAAVFLRP